MLTFYERFTFSLGNSDRWLPFAVRPAPQTWHHKPGIIAGHAGCHGSDSQMGRGGFGWSLRPPRQAAHKTKTRGPFLAGQSTSQFVSQLASLSRYQSDCCTSQSESSQSDGFTSQSESSQTTLSVSESVSVRRLYQSVSRCQSDGFTSQ